MAQTKSAIVVTTINYPTTALKELQVLAGKSGSEFFIIGDSKSPLDFKLSGTTYLDLRQQRELNFRFAQLCPVKHYARKNIGYLAAMKAGASIIIETDDDNIPRASFVEPRARYKAASIVQQPGWCNAYSYFSDALIWPRGLPLDRIKDPSPALIKNTETFDCPIQQGLADENPDVDAIYRLLLPLPMEFKAGEDVVLDKGVWCPFNSQNTTWWQEAYPLLYLPFHCSFRMTDIWRSFVAQRIAWECDWRLLFHRASVFQERNEHDLMVDFRDEVVGYLHNDRIRKTLEDLPLRSGREAIPQNLMIAYDALIKLELIASDERQLLHAWLEDISTM